METTFGRFLNLTPRILLVLLLMGLCMLPLGPQESHAEEPGDITVNSTADNLVAGDGLCTLREAISNANADADTTGGDCAPGVGVDTILLPAGTYTLAIAGTDEDLNATGDLDISDADGLTIIGDGPQATVIQAGTSSPVSDTCTDCVDRVLHTPGTTGGALELSGLTIRHGMPPVPTGGGGGDFWHTDLSLTDVVVTDNLVRGDGDGGGLRLWHCWLDATRCAFVNNRATNPGTPTAAGGLDIHHTVATLTNVTISGNRAHKVGGGLRVIGASSALIQYSTILDNRTEIGGKGGGLHISEGASVTLIATILAGNTEASADISMDDCGWWAQYDLYTDGNNLLGDGTGCPAGASDVTTTDISAELDLALALNGGLTPNHANQDGGRQLNTIPVGTNGCGTDITEDQRGFVRPQDAGCDIGAYEGLPREGGFVTGGGWIMAPEGSCPWCEDSPSAKTHFRFVAKHKKGASVPSGNTGFQFKAGGLRFRWSSYDWLVIADQDRAKFKGSGTVNGSGNYGFMLTATDGSPDTFRIKIWDKNSGDAVVYDNKMGATDYSYDGSEIGGGNIKVHKK